MKDEGSITGVSYETGIGEPQQTGMSIAWFGLAVVEGQFSSSFIDFPWILCVLHTSPFLECNTYYDIMPVEMFQYCLLLNLLPACFYILPALIRNVCICMVFHSKVTT